MTRRFELCLLLACAGPAACGDSGREALPDWSDGFEDGDIAPENDGGTVFVDDGGMPIVVPTDKFAITKPPELTYPIRIGRRDNLAEACAIAPGDGEKEITCVLDMDELDMWVLGLAFDVVVPEGMCDFLHYWSYIYANFEPGTGPTDVSWTENDDGTFADEVNASFGKADCPFDYSDDYPSHLMAPNCCTGAYVQKVKNAATGKVTTSRHDWGGSPGTCFQGGGYQDTDREIGSDGFPLAKYVYLDRKAHLERKRYDGPSDFHPANIPLANYWNPDDHDGGAPVALTHPSALPYYEFYCEDDAEELIAHIRVLVREWNEASEFDSRGDPDTDGMESGWDTPINDIYDWRDVSPGTQGYPKYVAVVK